jgi:hypothetical protein
MLLAFLLICSESGQAEYSKTGEKTFTRRGYKKGSASTTLSVLPVALA